MSDVPTDEGLASASLFDDDDEDLATVVDMSFYEQPDIPRYPAIARYGRFEILGRLARGGMAEIFLARDRDDAGSERHVVIKRVLPHMADDEQFARMFLDEGRIATRLYHPNVCHVYECAEIEGTYFMALEWVYGVPLRRLVRRTTEMGRLPVAVAVKILSYVADALSYAHDAQGPDGRPLGIVHRDVTPHNIMLSWNGQVKLLDFGIAKASTQQSKTQAGVLKGKYSYMSPEQAMGKAVDRRSDVFSLGICLYETVTGKPLYHRDSSLETLRAIVDEPPPSLRDVVADAPEELDAIVRRALQKAPDYRFQSAGEMRDALEGFLDRTGGQVDSTAIKELLDRAFDESERDPLPKKSAKVTGSFESLTPSAESPLSESGSYGPFGRQDQRPPSQAPPPPPEPERIDVVPPEPPAPVAASQQRTAERELVPPGPPQGAKPSALETMRLSPVTVEPSGSRTWLMVLVGGSIGLAVAGGILGLLWYLQ